MPERKMRLGMKDHAVAIIIDPDRLAYALENSPRYWNPETEKSRLKVKDSRLLAKCVARELFAWRGEGSDGSLIEEAIEKAADKSFEAADDWGEWDDA